MEYKEFVSKVCKVSGCQEALLKTKCRKREIVQARQIVIAYRHVVMGYTQVRSTSVFSMNYATVGHCIRTIQTLFQVDKPYRNTFGELLTSEETKEILTYQFNSHSKN